MMAIMVMMAMMVTFHDGNNGHNHDKDDGDAARSQLGLIQPCPGQPPLLEWGTRSAKSVVWFHIEYSQLHIHILVRKVVCFKSKIPANEKLWGL